MLINIALKFKLLKDPVFQAIEKRLIVSLITILNSGVVGYNRLNKFRY